MMWVVVSLLILLLLGQVVTWFGLWAVAVRVKDEIHRQDDRIRKRADRGFADDDEEAIGKLVDNLWTEPGAVATPESRYELAKKLEEFN